MARLTDNMKTNYSAVSRVDVTELVRISIILLLVSTGVALFSRKIGIPYVTGLVLAGLPFSEFMSQSVGLDPVLVLNQIGRAHV